MPGRYDTRVSRATYGLIAVLILTLATFGSVADRALVGQARSAAEAARTEDERRAQLTGQAVRATIAQIEQAVVGDTPWPGVSVARVVDSQNISAPRPSEVPYGRRAELELLALLTSTGLSGSGLPEAVVAAVALARPGHRAKVGERLLSGILAASSFACSSGVGSPPAIAGWAPIAQTVRSTTITTPMASQYRDMATSLRSLG